VRFIALPFQDDESLDLVLGRRRASLNDRKLGIRNWANHETAKLQIGNRRGISRAWALGW